MDELKNKIKEIIDENFTSSYIDSKGYLYDLLEKNNIINLLNPQKEEIILDAGCGDGRFTYDVAKKAKEVYAVDFSEKIINIINKRVKDENILNIKTFCLDLTEEFPYDFPKFDKIFSIQVFQHIPQHQERIKALKNIYNALKENGIFLLSVFNGNRIMDRLKMKKREIIEPSYGWIYYYFFKASELKKMFKEIGFKNIKIYGSHNFPGRIYKYNFCKKIIGLDIYLNKTFLSKYLGIYLMVIGYKL